MGRMIHIATVHWNTERWIALQHAYLQKHLKSEFRVYAWLNNIPDAPTDTFYYSTREPVASHAVKLNLLADVICAASRRDDDLIIFLDGDAFPVGELEPLINQALATTKLLAIQRLENNGDSQPHPCFCATTVGFWRKIKGDWKEGYRWKNKNGQDVTDVGGNLLKQLTLRHIEWTPILRSNQTDLHPLFFGIYGDVIYHHGAGFRKGETRVDRANLRLSPRDRILSKLIPGYGRRMRKKAFNQVIANNDALSEQVFKSIQTDPEFYKLFSGTPTTKASKLIWLAGLPDNPSQEIAGQLRR